MSHILPLFAKVVPSLWNAIPFSSFVDIEILLFRQQQMILLLLQYSSLSSIGIASFHLYSLNIAFLTQIYCIERWRLCQLIVCSYHLSWYLEYSRSLIKDVWIYEWMRDSEILPLNIVGLGIALTSGWDIHFQFSSWEYFVFFCVCLFHTKVSI